MTPNEHIVKLEHRCRIHDGRYKISTIEHFADGHIRRNGIAISISDKSRDLLAKEIKHARSTLRLHVAKKALVKINV